MAEKQSGTRFVPDPNDDNFDLHDFDSHYYEKKVGASDLKFSLKESVYSNAPEKAFEAAIAAAKDKARKNLVRALRAEEERLRSNSFSGVGDFSQQARENIYKNRTVDGVSGVTDNEIEL